jgi:hypothetical protein
MESTTSVPEERVRGDACWPDHIAKHAIVLDDVSQLSETVVDKLVMVRTEEDVFRALEYAVKSKLQVTW